MTLNILKLTAVGQLRRKKQDQKNGRKAELWLYIHFQSLGTSYVTAPS